jgi:hypothetical protein
VTALDPPVLSALRTVFLDIDGTYAHRGVVPPGHARAVSAVRAAGHRVFLCTGRPRSMVPPRILDAGFDGMVAGAGVYVLVDDQVLADRRFPPDLATRVVEVLTREGVGFILEAPDALFGRPGAGAWLTALLAGVAVRRPTGRQGPTDVLDVLRTCDDMTTVSFGKVLCFDSAVDLGALAAAIGSEVSVLPSSIPGMGDSAGELYLTGVHKAVGMQLVAEHLGLRREDIIGVGDGLNDIEMLAFAGTSVAIAGADPCVLAVADHVAAGPDEEGLVQLFVDLGLV